MSAPVFLLLLNTSGGTISSNFVADAVLKGTVPATFVADAWIVPVPTPVGFTANAVLKATIGPTRPFVRDAVKSSESGSTAYPTAVVGDLLLLTAFNRDSASGLTAPAGFNDLTDNQFNSESGEKIFYRWADGTESGTVTATGFGAQPRWNTMLSIGGILPASGTPNAESIAVFNTFNNAIFGPTVVSGTNSLALAFGYVSYAAGGSITGLGMAGETGGDWVHVLSESSSQASDGTFTIQRADITVSGGMSGGNVNTPNSSGRASSCVAFAFKGVNAFTADAVLKRTVDSSVTPYETIQILGSTSYFNRTASNSFFTGIKSDMIPAGLSNEDTIVLVSTVRNSSGGNDPTVVGSTLSWSMATIIRASGVGSARLMWARYGAGEDLTVPNFGDSGTNETGSLTVLYLRNVDPVMIDATPVGTLNSIDPPATTQGGVMQLIFGVGGTDYDGDDYSIGTAGWNEIAVDETATTVATTALGTGVWERTISTAENHASFATMSHTSGGNLLQYAIPLRPVTYQPTTFTADAYMPLSITDVTFTADAIIEPKVVRLGGTSTNFGASNSGAAETTAFTLPTDSDYLLVFLDIYETSVTASTVVWKPDSGDAGANQSLVFIDRENSTSRNVEVWGLSNPTATVTGSLIETDLSGSSKKIMGVHALKHVGYVGTPVKQTTTSTEDTLTVNSGPRSMVFDSGTGSNSTTTYTVGANQTSHWNTNTTGGLDNLRGIGSSEPGAYPTVTMTWTHISVNTAHIALNFDPPPWSRDFTADAVLLDTIGKNDISGFTAVLGLYESYPGNLVPGFLEDSLWFTADAVLEASGSATIADDFTADAVILRTEAASFTGDAVLLKTVATTFTADAVILRTETVTFTADAVILRTEAATFTADAVIFKTNEVTFTADSYLIWVQTGSFTADSVLLRTESATFTADAILKKTVEVTFTADSVISNTISVTFSADSILLRIESAAFTADAVVQRTEADDFTADAYLLNVISASFTADASFIATVSGSFTADAYFLDINSEAFAADAVLKRTESVTFTGDSVLKATLAGSFTGNAVIVRTEPVTFVADAILRDTEAVTFTADARIQVVVSAQPTANAVLKRTEEEEFLADSILLLPQEAEFTADAELVELVEATFTADAEFVYPVFERTGIFTADAMLRVIIDQAFTGDSLLRSAGNIRPPQIGAGRPGIAIRGGGAGTRLGAGGTTKVRPTRGYPRVIAK